MVGGEGEQRKKRLARPCECLKRAQLATGEVQMASAFVHRLFTQGHVKYVRFHGDRAAGVGFFGRGRVPVVDYCLPVAAASCVTPVCGTIRGNLHGESAN